MANLSSLSNSDRSNENRMQYEQLYGARRISAEEATNSGTDNYFYKLTEIQQKFETIRDEMAVILKSLDRLLLVTSLKSSK